MEPQILIAEIAKRHNVRLKPDDPAFVLLSLNELVLAHHLEMIRGIHIEQEQRTELEYNKRLDEASLRASSTINEAGRFAEKCIQQAGESIQEELKATVEKQLKLIQQESASQSGPRSWSLYVMIAACSLILGILLGIFLFK